MDIKNLRENYVAYPDLDRTRNYFLAACRYYQTDLDANTVLEECPHGGTIGIGGSRLHKIFRHWKVFRLQAISRFRQFLFPSIHFRNSLLCFPKTVR